ncbi:P1 family peptidase [Phytoactinopolyspora limicola]|uniref:P1 family peptidase n=1 Tax=Phytoactinopolyspora limicola TaxID=2715536 RepID=UPI001A9C8EA1|nr:P1 family peptidase [Phytoactinopolyspora limicola]
MTSGTAPLNGDVRLSPVSAFAAGGLTNTDTALAPQVSPGRGNVEFDLPGVLVGTAEYAEGPTGCTVVLVPDGARTAVDARGGAVGLGGGYDVNHAICLAGGSVHGLGAAAGVTDELMERHQRQTRWTELRLVSGAVIYDFSCRDNAIVPDATLGRAAVRQAVPGVVPVGRCGAGRSATVGKVNFGRAEFAGQGAAFAAVGDVRVLVVTVPNAIGVVVDRAGTVVRGNYDAERAERRHPATDYEAALRAGGPAAPVGGNTTLTVLVTNVKLSDYSLNQLARQVHSSMHRGIQPFHTENDGDVLFALTTDQIELPGTVPTGLGTIASEVAWDAVLSAAV